MNMIASEQQAAWSDLPCLHGQKSIWLTSGIRAEEKNNYLIQTQKWGWHLENEQEKQGWLAFCFKFLNKT